MFLRTGGEAKISRFARDDNAGAWSISDTIWNLSRSCFDKARDRSVNEVYLLENFAGDNFLA